MAASVVSAPTPPITILDEIDNDFAIRAHILRTALELDVVPAIAAGHRDAAAVARATGCSPVGIRVLCDGLCALGLLRWVDGAYALSPTADAFLVPGTPTYCAPLFLEDLRSWDSFTENVRSGQVRTDVATPDSMGLWVAYASSQALAWPDDLDFYRERWSGIGVTRETAPGVRVLDVACGPAVVTLALAHDDPTATVTGLDWDPVVEVARRVAEAMGVASQASFVAGDVTALAGLEGPFDVVFLGHFLHFLDPGRIVATFREVHRLLAPAGRVVIREILATPGDFGDPYPFFAAAWLFNVARRGRVYAFEEYAAMLAEAGFGPAHRLEGTTWLHAERDV
jgi:2-polyprenyl-3-methyl-5-hydroxy-6-metoxy-1,4-benzoquinol methylase